MGKEEIVLSVIVPVYNTSLYLKRCLDSILRQDLKNLEIICVDDGSTDESGAILDQYALIDNRVHVIHKNNGGLVSARKAGLEMAVGKYVAYVDSDDWIEANMYDDMVRVADEYHVDMVASGFIRDYGTHVVVDNEKAEAGFYEGNRLKNEIKNHLVDYDTPFSFKLSPSLCNKIFFREALKRHQMGVPNAVTIDEDTVCSVPYLMNCNSIYVAEKSYYHYCSRGDSMLNKKDRAESYSAQIQIAYDYLGKRVENSICRYYEVYARLQMCPETVLDYTNGALSFFGTISKNERIIVYGAGSFGVSLKRYLKDNGFNVIACADKRGDGEGIIKPSALSTIAFDYVLVGILLWEVRQNAIEDLRKLGIRDSKICQVQLHGDGCCD